MKSKYVVGHLILFLVLYHAVALSYNIMFGSEPSPELFICFFFGAFGLGAQFFSVVNRHLVKK